MQSGQVESLVTSLNMLPRTRDYTGRSVSIQRN